MTSTGALIERLEWSGDGRTGTVLVLPGAHGGIFQAALYWSTVALVDAGWEVLVAQWSARPDEREVASAADVGLARFASAAHGMVMGKSLGSLAAPVVGRAGVRAIWFTPLMDRTAVASAIRSSSAPTMVVGGTADPSWQRPAERDGMLVVEIAGANHGLVVPGEWRHSLAQLEVMVESVLGFATEDPRQNPGSPT